MKNHIKSEFKFPDLVNQAYDMMKQMGQPVRKSDIYQTMLSEGLITPDGQPTEMALQQGLIEEVHQLPVNPSMGAVERLKAEHPIYQRFDDHHFIVDPETGDVMIDSYVTSTIAWEKLADPQANEKQKQTAIKLLRKVGEL